MEVLKKIEAVRDRLYSENRMSGDEMRNSAQALDAAVVILAGRAPDDPKDIIIRTLRAEVAELANLLEEAAADIEDRTAGESEAFSLRLRSDAARALLARLEARP